MKNKKSGTILLILIMLIGLNFYLDSKRPKIEEPVNLNTAKGISPEMREAIRKVEPDTVDTINDWIWE